MFYIGKEKLNVGLMDFAGIDFFIGSMDIKGKHLRESKEKKEEKRICIGIL